MVDEVFKNLVDQFSDPFTCLRELVQNAMDAGTEQIEVKTRYLSDPGGVCLEIRDFGEGMNRDIIDGKLTRLFSSDKENDLTKIGKFGIGFVSVFSLKPELVTVDTGRDGEFWRIAFDGGTDYQLFELHDPLEGTSVKIYKLLNYEDLEEFDERCAQTISRWCRHSHIDISFNGETINRPMEVNSDCRIQISDPLGLFDVGLSNANPSDYGFYNTGLTLTEGESEEHPGVTFKILSNHLEHTLTRDAVIVDENYHKVMARLKQIVEEDLFQKVCQDMSSDEQTRETCAALVFDYLANRLQSLTRTQLSRPFLRNIDGSEILLKDLIKCAKKEQRIFTTDTESGLSERALREDIPVLNIGEGSATAQLLSSLLSVPVVRLEANLAVSRVVERAPGLKSITSSIQAMLREGGILVSKVVAVEYPDAYSSSANPPCTFALGPDRLVRRFRKGYWASKYLLPQQLLLDTHHPMVRKALNRAENPALAKLAAYCLCKSALLNDGLDPGTEQKLLKRLMEKN